MGIVAGQIPCTAHMRDHQPGVTAARPSIASLSFWAYIAHAGVVTACAIFHKRHAMEGMLTMEVMTPQRLSGQIYLP